MAAADPSGLAQQFCIVNRTPDRHGVADYFHTFKSIMRSKYRRFCRPVNVSDPPRAEGVQRFQHMFPRCDLPAEK